MSTNRSISDAPIMIDIAGDNSQLLSSIDLARQHVERLQNEAAKPNALKSVRLMARHLKDKFQTLDSMFKKTIREMYEVSKMPTDSKEMLKVQQDSLKMISEQREFINEQVNELVRNSKEVNLKTQEGLDLTLRRTAALKEHVELLKRKKKVERLSNKEAQERARKAIPGQRSEFELELGKGQLADMRSSARAREQAAMLELDNLKAKMAEVSAQAQRMGGDLAVQAQKINESFKNIGIEDLTVAKKAVRNFGHEVNTSLREEVFQQKFSLLKNELKQIGQEAINSGKITRESFEQIQRSFEHTGMKSRDISLLTTRLRTYQNELRRTTSAKQNFTQGTIRARGQLGGLMRTFGGMRSFMQPGMNGIASLSMGLYGIHPAVGAAVMGISSLKSTLEGLFRIAREGAEQLDMFEAYQRMSDIDPLPISQLRDALKGTVDDQTLMKYANLGRQIGLTGQDVIELAEVAKAASETLGESVDHMFRGIVTGTARRERRILNRLGIGVESLNFLYASRAEAMGKAVSELTKEEKDYIFVQEVLQRSEVITASAIDARADAYLRLGVRVKNVHNVMKQAWAGSFDGQEHTGLGDFFQRFEKFSAQRATGELEAITNQLVHGHIAADDFNRSLDSLRAAERDQKRGSQIYKPLYSASPFGFIDYSSSWFETIGEDWAEGTLRGYSAAIGRSASTFISLPLSWAGSALWDSVLSAGAMAGFVGDFESAFDFSLADALENYLDVDNVIQRIERSLETVEISLRSSFERIELPFREFSSNIPVPFSQEFLTALEENLGEAEKIYLDFIDNSALSMANSRLRDLFVRSLATSSLTKEELRDSMKKGIENLGLKDVSDEINEIINEALREAFSDEDTDNELLSNLTHHRLEKILRESGVSVQEILDEHINKTRRQLSEKHEELSKLRQSQNSLLGSYSPEIEAQIRKLASETTDLSALIDVMGKQREELSQMVGGQIAFGRAMYADRGDLRNKASQYIRTEDLEQLFLEAYPSVESLNDAMYERFKDYESIIRAYDLEIATYSMMGGSIDQAVDALRTQTNYNFVSADVARGLREGEEAAMKELYLSFLASEERAILLRGIAEEDKKAIAKYRAMYANVTHIINESKRSKRLKKDKEKIIDRPVKTGRSDGYRDFARLLDQAAAMVTDAHKFIVEAETPLLQEINSLTSSYDSSLSQLYNKRGEIMRHRHAHLADLEHVNNAIKMLTDEKGDAIQSFFSDKRKELTDYYLYEALGVEAFGRANDRLEEQLELYTKTLDSLKEKTKEGFDFDFGITGKDLVQSGAPQALFAELRKGLRDLNLEQVANLVHLSQQIDIVKEEIRVIEALAEHSREVNNRERTNARFEELQAFGSIENLEEGMGLGKSIHIQNLEKEIELEERIQKLKLKRVTAGTFGEIDDLDLEINTLNKELRELRNLVIIRTGEHIDETKMIIEDLNRELNELKGRFNLDTVTRSAEMGMDTMLFGINHMLDLTEWRMEEWASSVGSFANTMINDIGNMLGVSASIATGGNMLVGGLVKGIFSSVGSFVQRLFNWNKSKDDNVRRAVDKLAEKKRDLNVFMTLEHHGLTLNSETVRNVARATRKAIEAGERI